MARIRTIKPEFFKHEDLFELEEETGLPIRIAFAGLWTCCDREGRFKWKPRTLKTDIMPYDDVDFSRVLDALRTRGFVVKYAVGDVMYGCVPTFLEHQIINNREKESDLPAVDDADTIFPMSDEGFDACGTRDQREGHAASGEGNGREGKGREEERKEVPASQAKPGPGKTYAPKKSRKQEPTPEAIEACRATWAAYSDAYTKRYGVAPLRDAKVNTQISNLVKRLGVEAPDIAGFYVWHSNAFYVTKGHDIALAVTDAAKLRTEWITGNRVTTSKAREADRIQTDGDDWRQIKEEQKQKREAMNGD